MYKNNLLLFGFPNQETGPEYGSAVGLVSDPFGMVIPFAISEVPSFISVISWIPPITQGGGQDTEYFPFISKPPWALFFTHSVLAAAQGTPFVASPDNRLLEEG